MISHIKNCITKNKSFTYIPYSKRKLCILSAIKQSGYIDRLSVLRYNINKANIAIEFRRVGKTLLIRDIAQVSKPGNRIYWSHKRITEEFGVFIVSTCRGVVNSTLERVHGGEIICKLI